MKNHQYSRRTFLGGAIGVASAFVIAACQPPQSGVSANSDRDDQGVGYVSGDGSVRIWDPAERNQPVELAGTTMAGDAVDITHWREDVVVLNFWYAACPPCRKEAPDLASLAREFEGEAHFLGVNHIDSPDTALAFERNFDLPYPSLHDQDAAGVAAMDGEVPLQAMPTTVVLDRQGRVAARVLGLADRSTLKALITDMLAEATA